MWVDQSEQNTCIYVKQVIYLQVHVIYIYMLITLVAAPDIYTCSCTDLLKEFARSKLHLLWELQNEN